MWNNIPDMKIVTPLKKTYFPILIALVAFFVKSFSPLRAYGSTLGQAITTLGFQPLDGAPVPFALRDLNGNTVKLEDQRGNWVFLVFWATWCQACKQKMPILESLHVAFQDENFKVLAISIDDKTSTFIQKYAKLQDLTYPILLDRKSDIAQKYQATSIPTTYLISPDQRIAGIARGVIKWDSEKMLSAIEDVLRFDHLPATADDKGFTLPDNLVPPVMAFIPPAEGFEVGEPNTLTIGISWNGSPDQFLIKVPKVKLPDDAIVVGKVSSSSSSADGQASLLYHFPLTFASPGEYLIGPVELAYQHRKGGQEQFTRLEAKTIRVAHQGGTSILIIILVIVGICTGSFFCFWWRRKKRRRGRRDHDHKGRARKQIELAYLNAKKLRVKGDLRQYGIEMVQLVHQISPSDQHAKTIEQLKFSNLLLSASELRPFEKEIEKYFQLQNSDQEEKA